MELLWKDNQSLTIGLSPNKSAKQFSVTAGGSVSGNAVVAVKYSDKVVWSYHIWVTNYDPDNGGTTYANSLSARNPTFMDRNLGALSDNTLTDSDLSARGLLYQWGRKDPFPGAKNLTQESGSSDTAPIYNARNEATSISLEQVSSTPRDYLNKAVENPTTFYYGLGTNNFDWYSREGGVRNDNLWQSDIKTVYDPCPKGWSARFR